MRNKFVKKAYELVIKNKIGFFSLLTLPIVLYSLPFLMTGGYLAAGDADYIMQTVEAARKTMLEYGQLPWWNPWVSGGVPLFANPQFGLFSIPMICGLIFGSVLGFKIALVLYLILGFWGMYLLLTKSFKTPLLTAILLGYVWTFGSYFVHRAAGHYTFFTIEYFPLLLYLYLQRRHIRHGWLWFGLILGLMVNAAAHNTTVMCLAVIGLFVLIELFKITVKFVKNRALVTSEFNLFDIRMLALSAVVVIITAGPRLLSSMDFIDQYPRNLASYPEETMGLVKALFAIFGPIRQYIDQPSIPSWSWMEASAYIGFATGIAALVCLAIFIKSRNLTKYVSGRISPLVLVILGAIFFLFGLGQFLDDLSPYNLLRHLPVFSDMRVASRWLIWTSLMVILFIGAYRYARHRKLINSLLAISVIELFSFGTLFFAQPYNIPIANYDKKEIISQQIHFDTKRNGAVYDENLTATTMANIGQVIAGDALIDTRNPAPFGADTIRCDSDASDCAFVLTRNATVITWSPNQIQLKRTGPGDIRLNMNPGKYWLVNDRYSFWNLRLAEPGKDFVITDTAEDITLKMQPKYSPDWYIWKIAQI